jgi:transcriptional regulator with XRE-family HTH domain
MEVGEKLAQARAYHAPKLAQKDLAKLLGLDTSTVGRWESKNYIPPEKLPVVSELLNVREEWFTDGSDIPPSGARKRPVGGTPPGQPAAEVSRFESVITTGGLVEIKYAGVVPASSWGDPLSGDDSRLIDAKYGGPNRFLATVLGESCEPALKSGDLTLWEAIPKGQEPHGLIVIAERELDHACTVKQYKKERGQDRLIPINTDFEEPTAAEGFSIISYLVGAFRTIGVERSWYFTGGLRPRDLIDPNPELDLYEAPEPRPGLRAAEPRSNYGDSR